MTQDNPPELPLKQSSPEDNLDLSRFNRIPHIKVQHLLGGGGMGLVYRAYHQELGRDVALKIAHPRSNEKNRIKSSVASLMHEAQIMSQLDHQHIAKMYDSGIQDEFAWFTLELIEGRSLRNFMNSEQMTYRQAIAFFLQLAEALEHIGSFGIIHQDLKPENVLIDCQQNCKIIDFGLAKMRGLSYTVARPGRVSGTLRYMAPEQLLHPRDIDQRSDLYALGVIMFELFTGERPEENSSLMAFRDIDEHIDNIVRRCLQPNPNDRWQSASELLAALDNACRDDIDRTSVWLNERTLRPKTLVKEQGSSTTLIC